MSGLFAFFGFVLALVWAFRIEINTAKTAEALQRIEKLLAEQKGSKK